MRKQNKYAENLVATSTRKISEATNFLFLLAVDGVCVWGDACASRRRGRRTSLIHIKPRGAANGGQAVGKTPSVLQYSTCTS